MKIGILTFHFSKNYGALFQAYALRKWLQEQGHEAEFINYQPEHLESGGKISFKTLFSKSTLKVVFLKTIELREKLFGNKNVKQGFDKFHENVLSVKRTAFKSKEELEACNFELDLLICGSDQIWNPSDHFGVDPVYFLDFKTHSSPKKISYAASFGRSEIPKYFHDEISALINKLDAISVREKSGVELVEKLTGKTSSLVPDPTLLLSDYSQLFEPYKTKSEDFVFCYYLRSKKTVDKVAQHVSDFYQLPIYSPHNPHRRWTEIGETIYPSPKQWLYLLNKSKFVVTNSFHGTALSILLNKPFVVVGIGGGRAKYNERVLNLLTQLGLESRIITEYSTKSVAELIKIDIDWDLVNQKVQTLRSTGEAFLLFNLEQINEEI
ncbi:polysaccharide pyruvyl transferase family protein [Thiomicrorhabdus hydrogeniphila]